MKKADYELLKAKIDALSTMVFHAVEHHKEASLNLQAYVMRNSDRIMSQQKTLERTFDRLIERLDSWASRMEDQSNKTHMMIDHVTTEYGMIFREIRDEIKEANKDHE